jgi:quinone-modifying oxidoreductase, subunit QmoC
MSMAQAPDPDKPAAAESSGTTDFGWRLRGTPVTVLEDRSFDLRDAERPPGSFLAGYCSDVTTLQTCLQCGACTASCNLAEEGSLFPRPEMTLVQMGLRERLLADPNVWHCYNCGDCSRRCPGSAKPGRVMAAVRHMATERFAFPGFLARAVNQPRRLWLVVLVPAALLLGAIAVGGSFRPAAHPVRFGSLLPHLTLNLFYSAFTALAVAIVVAGLGRAWRAWRGESLARVRPGAFLRALGGAVGEILAHRKFADCEHDRAKRWAHLGLFYGFVGLAALSGVVVVLILAGRVYPMSALHPLKILGNLFALLLIGGGLYLLRQRWLEAQADDRSTYFDWAFLADVLLVGVTGVLTEAFRFADWPWPAYAIYFVHLVLVFLLLVLLPYSKFAHVAYRTLAVTARRYDVLLRKRERGAMVDDQSAARVERRAVPREPR